MLFQQVQSGIIGARKQSLWRSVIADFEHLYIDNLPVVDAWGHDVKRCAVGGGAAIDGVVVGISSRELRCRRMHVVSGADKAREIALRYDHACSETDQRGRVVNRGGQKLVVIAYSRNGRLSAKKPDYVIQPISIWKAGKKNHFLCRRHQNASRFRASERIRKSITERPGTNRAESP